MNRNVCGLEIRDTADLEVCATIGVWSRLESVADVFSLVFFVAG